MNGSSAAVWVTRTQPAARLTADRLRALGFAPHVQPVLAIRPVAAEPCLDGVGALCFTSVNGVLEFARRLRRRDLPVFAVGDATAQAALGCGFIQVRSAGGDVRDLAQLILASRPGIQGGLLWAGAREPAGDLIAVLRGQGVEAAGCALYESVAELETPALRALIEGGDAPAAALVYSPKAARRIAEALAGCGPSAAFICISAAAAAPLIEAGLATVTATRPNEPQMLRRLLILFGQEPKDEAAAPAPRRPVYWRPRRTTSKP